MIRDDMQSGIFNRNPLVVLGLGLCPAIPLCVSLTKALMLGLCITLVLIGTNCAVSLLCRVMPERARMAGILLSCAAIVSALQLMLQAYFPAVDTALGMFIPLLSVNCLVLCRARGYAEKNKVGASFLDGCIMGAGYTLALCAFGGIRELVGHASLCNWPVYPSSAAITLFVLVPGGFFILAAIIGFVNFFKQTKGSR